MKLEEIAAEIRPRRGWEAIDLGCALLRRWFVPLWLSWWLTTLPVCVLIIGLLWNHPFLALFCIYWLKPVFERVPLFLLSRALFGDEPKLGKALKAWPRLFFSSPFVYFGTIRFFTWANRSVYMPIRELEGLRGGRYGSRAAVIGQHAGGYAVWLSLICWLFEFALTLGCLGLLYLMIPSGLVPEVGELFVEFWEIGSLAFAGERLIWLWRVLLVSWLVAISIVELIYVAAGFGLYLNSRSHQEGWDIELTFRRLANRLRKPLAAALMFGLLGLSTMPLPAQAQPSQAEMTLEDFLDPIAEPASGESPETLLETVLEDDAYTVHSRIEKTYVPSNRSFGAFSLPFVETIAYGLLILAVVSILGFIIYAFIKNRSSMPLRRRQRVQAGPREVMGMDITPDSLPDDVISTARSLWAAGDHQAAISLLYRAAISDLVLSDQVEIRESDTESDCLRRARAGLSDAGRLSYFADLTGTWMGLAYGRITPSDAGVDTLCQQWPFSTTPGGAG